MVPGDLVAVTCLRTWRYVGWPQRPTAIEPDFMLSGCRHEGEYIWMHGPSYETRAEIRALQRLGGAVVGMSTAPEVARCRERGIRAAVVSCVTNNCCAPGPVSHDSVVRAARAASTALVQLLRSEIPAVTRVQGAR
jgi:purine-nucleoside phosphorylase